MFHYGHQRKRARTVARGQPLSPGSASPPLPRMPDVGEPRVHGGAASLGTKVRDSEQPPMYPGMLPHLKPEYIDMELLRRQTTTAGKAKFKGLPHKHNLAVPMLKKFVEHNMSMLRLGLGCYIATGNPPGKPGQRTLAREQPWEFSREAWPGNPRQRTPWGNSPGEAAQGIPVRD